MSFDYKKEYKELYLPPKTPTIINVPPLAFIAVRGKGNPNDEEGEYSDALKALYSVAYTIKMSYKGTRRIPHYFEYVVPPLEGLWWQEGVRGFDTSRKEDLSWISLIRLPEFVSSEDVDWAIGEATRKKEMDLSKVEYFTYDEGLCVQCMHLGSYDDELQTVQIMDRFAEEQGYVPDFSQGRHHHEIYLSDPRKTAPEKLRTVLRHPIATPQ